MASYRLSRVRELLLRELSDIIQRMKDPRVGFVTVMDVEVTRDLKKATMFVSVVGDEQAKKEATEALQKALGHIRHEVAQRVELRHVPELEVVYDETSERAARVSALLDRIQEECPPAPLEESAAPAAEDSSTDGRE